MTRVARSLVALSVFLAAAGLTGAEVQAQVGSGTETLIVAEEGFELQGLEVSSDYVFQLLQWNVFLRSDESGVIYMAFRIQNRGYTPLDTHTWCFYWGRDKYSNVYARDGSGYLDTDYYDHYSDTFHSWGVCVETAMREPIQPSEDYEYGVGITVEDYHRVYYDEIDASWRVVSHHDIERYVNRASWPLNHEGFSAEPEPDELGDAHAVWERTDQDAPFDFTIHVQVSLGDEMAVDPLSQGTMPYDGGDISWEDDDYGLDTNRSIGEWGCYLTSGNMAMNYFAKVLGFATSIDPGDLNSWLREPAGERSTVPRGYAADPEDCPGGSYCLVRSSMFDDASEDLFDATEPVIIPGAIESLQSIQDMENNLQDGDLGILNVISNGAGHFVLVTGYTSHSGVETVAINDPFENRGHTTLYEQYGNSYLEGVRWFSPGNRTVRPNYVTLYADCPVELLVTDEYGRRTGYDPRTGMRYNEIPSSDYVLQYQPNENPSDNEGTKILQIQAMDYSNYDVEVIGTGHGSYQVKYEAELAYVEDEFRVVTGETSWGEVDEYHVSFDPNRGFPDEVFLPLVLRQPRGEGSE